MNKIKVTDYAIELINNFDTTNLLAVLGAMNLCFENQNKNYATSYYSTYILFNQNNGRPKPSRKTLLSLIDELNKSGIIYPIQDPPEAPFFQKILYDREYSVFNGVDHHAAFFVSRLCEMLLFGDCVLLPNQFIILLRKIVKSTLSLSDSICKRLNPRYDDIMNYLGDKEIVFPPNIEQLKTLLYFDKSELFKIGLSEEDIQRYMVFHFSPAFSLIKCLEKEIPYYYSRPFLDCDDKMLLIDPTAVNTYLRYISIELSESFKCKQVFLNLINETFFSWGEWQIRKFIHNFSDENSHFANFKYENNETYKEKIIPFSKSKIILYSAYFDNVLEGKSVTIKIDKYHSLIKKQIDELDDKYDVVTILLGFSYGAGINIREPSVFKNNNLMMAFDEFESFAINEKDNPCFLFSAVDFLRATRHVFSPTMGAINRIAFLRDRDYDFYINDKADAYSANLFLGFEYTYHYRVLAAKEETTFVVPFYKQLMLLEKDSDNVYYISSRFFDIDKVITFNRYPSGGVWVFSRTIEYNLFTFIGMVNYWLTNLQSLLKKIISDCFYYIELTLNEMSNIVVDKVGNTCSINIYPLILSLNDDSDFDEIDLIEKILDYSSLLTSSVKNQLETDRYNINKRYNTPLKTDQIMLIPCRKQLRPVFVSKYYSALFDDSLGRDYAINKCGLTPGETIRDADGFLKGVIEKLFSDLEKYIKDFDWLSSTKFLYEYQEDYLQKLLISQKNLKVKHALYSNHVEDINKIYYDLNSASPGIRFLLQYLATLQHEGEKTMDEVDLEMLITLIHKIIHLANIDDGIVFNLLPNEMSFLESRRLSIDLKKLETFNALIAGEMISVLTKDGVKLNDNQKWPFNKELNEAYLEEYGFTFDQMTQTIAFLISFGEGQEDEIKIATIKDVLKSFKEFHNSKISIDEPIIIKIINHLSILKRKTFFDCSIAKPREFYPWRYNRTESITRKPIIKYGDKIIWGNRTLYQCYVFTLGHVYEGNEPTKNPSNSKIKALNGKVLELKGERFNDLAFDYLRKNITDINFYKCVKSFNNKRMNNEKGEFLGDIDILGIDEKKHRIYLIEVKNYQYSKNMAELGFELNEFLGTHKNKGFVRKEMNRVIWVKNHLDDVIKEYKLDDGKWKVFYTFLSNKPLLCSILGGASFNNVSIDQVSKKYLNGLIE